VPRCRMMMLPGMQRCPPNSFTPRYLGLESLVFCVEPPCFLEAQRSCCSCRPAAAEALAALALHSTAALRPAAAAREAQHVLGQAQEDSRPTTASKSGSVADKPHPQDLLSSIADIRNLCFSKLMLHAAL
jgi:hypothetical protein